MKRKKEIEDNFYKDNEKNDKSYKRTINKRN
jgi:hypothetical protein